MQLTTNNSNLPFNAFKNENEEDSKAKMDETPSIDIK